MKTSYKNPEPKSFFVVSKGITAKWMFSVGEDAEEEQVDDDFCWETTVSTVPVDFDDDSSILYEDEFAEEVADDVAEICQALHDEEVSKEDVSCSTPPSSPPKENTLLQRCYKEFKEMSLSPSYEQKRSISSVMCPVRLTISARRASTGRKKYSQTRLNQSDHNRDLIRESMKYLLDF